MVVQFQDLIDGLNWLLQAFHPLTQTHTCSSLQQKKRIFIIRSRREAVTIMCFHLNTRHLSLDLHDVSLNILLGCWNPEPSGSVLRGTITNFEVWIWLEPA